MQEGRSGGRQERSPRRYAALGHGFTFSSPDGTLSRHVEGTLAGLATSAPPGHHYVHMIDDGIHRLWRDDELLGRPGPAAMVLPLLLWDVNRRAVADTPIRTLIHAGAVAHSGTAVVLAGASGAGKTTVTAALVRAGLGYLSDEMAVIDPATCRLHPFRRPLTLKPGCWSLFPELAPPGEALAPYLTHQWQVPAEVLRPHAPVISASPRLIVELRRVAGDSASLHPLARSEALLMLASHLLSFPGHPRRDFDALAQVVAGARCFRLDVGGLHDAVGLVLAALDELTEQSA